MSRWPIALLRFLLLVCLCSLLLLPMAFAAKNAFAFNDPITIISATDEIHFPTSIDFTLRANDTGNSITKASIYITFKEGAYAPVVQHGVPIHTPSTALSLTWHEDTSGSSFHYPGTPVQYYWVLQDSAGHQHNEVPQNFTTLDTRFSWQHLSQGLLQVNWYDRPQDFGQMVLDKAHTSITHISQMLGGGLLHSINLWVYASNDDFHGALAPGSYEWVGGEAHPLLNEAFISVTDSEDDTLRRDMPHELTHLVFHQLTSQGPLAPTWFDEGLAVYNQLYHEPEMYSRFSQALIYHALLRLDNIARGFPADSDKAYLAYAQSWQLIDYMYSTFGQVKMALLIKNMNAPQADFGQDLTQVLGEDQLHLENQWHLHLNQPPVLSPDQITPTPKPVVHTSQPQRVPTDTTAPWLISLGSLLILLPIVGIVIVFVYQRRKRQQAWAVEAAQSIMTSTMLPQQPANSLRNTDPSLYAPPTSNAAFPPQQAVPPPYMTFPYPRPEQGGVASNGHVGLPPQPPSAPPHTPNIAWQTDYPATKSGDGENESVLPFIPFQENLSVQPRKQAPQE